MNTIGNDLQFALRQLRRSPALALTAILTLALGIGANTAIFSLLDQALLRSLPVRDPRQLVVLEGTGDAWEGGSSSHGGDIEAYFSYPMYRDLQAQAKTHGMDDLLATSPADLDITFRNASQLATGEVVSGNYFTMLGTNAYRGRLLTPSDDSAPGANPVAVVSYSFWQSHLDANPSIVGQTISLNNHPFQIVGIAAPNFHSAIWGENPALFVPMSMLEQAIPGRGKRLTSHKDRWLNILGRLAPGQTRDRVEGGVAPVWHALRASELQALGITSPRFVAEFLTRSRLRVLPAAQGFSYQRGSLKQPLLVVMGMALLVLTIASINVGSLLLVRSAGRMREFSLRAALGARGGRIVAQLLTEGLLIGLLGGAAGLALAPFAVRVLVRQLAGSDGDSAFSTSLDGRVLAFNFAVALAVSLFFSLAPSLQLRRPDLTKALRGTQASATGGMLRLRRGIVCLQIGLSLLLLAIAGLFVRTMQNLRAVDVGFNATHLVTFDVTPRLAGYTPDRIPALDQHLLETLQAIPGVQSVAATNIPELAGDSHGGNISIEGYTPPPDEDVDVEKANVNPGFFSAMRIPLLAGRAFEDSDDATHPLVAIVNQSLAKKYFGSAANALHRRLMDGGSNKPVYNIEIVGVVPDFKQRGIRDTVLPSLFTPLRQAAASDLSRQLYFYLRGPLPAAATMASVRHAVRQVDAAVAIDNLRTMDEQIDQNLSNDRLTALLAIAFGVLATLLAGVGLYGVLAYTTAQRTREIGIRMALGSTRAAISRIVLGDVLRLAGLGIALALPVAYGLSRLLRSQLFGVSPADPLAMIFAVLLISTVAFLAALIPAVRAASISPTEALRTE
jgi:predicted permease